MQASALVALLSSCAVPGEDAELALHGTYDNPRTLEEIRASKFLNVGILTDAEPFAHLNSNGNYSGFDHYFCLFLAEKKSIAINYVPLDPQNRYEELLANKVDVCVAQMSPSDAEASGAECVGSLYKLQLGVVSPEDAPVTQIEQLEQGELIVCAGSYAQQYAAEAWPSVSLRPYDTLTDAYIALEQGKGIAMLSDEINAACWIEGRKGYVLGMTGIGEPRTVAPAVAAGQANPDLVELLDEVVRTFYTYGYARKAYETFIEPCVGTADYTSMLTPPQ